MKNIATYHLTVHIATFHGIIIKILLHSYIMTPLSYLNLCDYYKLVLCGCRCYIKINIFCKLFIWLKHKWIFCSCDCLTNKYNIIQNDISDTL
jgi:hypothetical protein